MAEDMTPAELAELEERSALVAAVINLGVPSYEAWLLSNEALAAYLPEED